tara:strand:- start:218 stop:502 length:285 start_codon:yes stop_codon:yes gene_type:complete
VVVTEHWVIVMVYQLLKQQKVIAHLVDLVVVEQEMVVCKRVVKVICRQELLLLHLVKEMMVHHMQLQMVMVLEEVELVLLLIHGWKVVMDHLHL